MTLNTRRLLTLMACSLWLGGMMMATKAQEPPKQSKGQQATDLCALDLTSEIDSGSGRRLRARLVTLEPGGVVAVHGHQDRPTIMHVVEGALLSHTAGQPDRIMRAGDCAAEGKAVVHHWMENTGPAPAKYIAIDVTK
jgi:quercetin dioxygenase-like cupin family protein